MERDRELSFISNQFSESAKARYFEPVSVAGAIVVGAVAVTARIWNQRESKVQSRQLARLMRAERRSSVKK